MKFYLFIISIILQPPIVEVIEKSKYHTFVEQGYTIIDVRTHEEYMQGHIPGAQNIDVRAETFITEIQELPKSDTLLVYCRSGCLLYTSPSTRDMRRSRMPSSA